MGDLYRKYNRYPLVRKRRRWAWLLSVPGDTLAWCGVTVFLLALLALEWMR